MTRCRHGRPTEACPTCSYVRPALDVYDAALTVLSSWLDVRASGADAVGAHDVAVRALGDALARAGVLDAGEGRFLDGDRLDPVARNVLSPGDPGGSSRGVT